jgi:hypothetical protein
MESRDLGYMNALELSKLEIQTVEQQTILRMSSNEVVPQFTVVVECNNNFAFRYLTTDVNHRSVRVIGYIDNLFRKHGGSLGELGKRFSFVVQGDDQPVDVPSVSFQTKKSYRDILLVPDFYYTEANGYRDFLPDQVPSWQDRTSRFLWRGSTTGGFGITPGTLDQLPRYRLCRAGALLGERADFGFYAVAQANSPLDADGIRDILMSESLWKPWIPLRDFSKYKFFVQIDGNGNSWDLVQKLRLGCCMLLVDSDWMLWHNLYLKEWVHYVPVERDLSDFNEIATWCLENDREAKTIAENARQFALDLDYDAEMGRAATNIFSRYSS